MTKYAVVDVETTGGSAGRHRVIEVGVVLMTDNEIEGVWGQLIQVDVPIPLNIQRLTGIQPRDLINQPKFNDIANYLHKLLENRIFVAHNVNFDYSFITEEFKKVGVDYEAPRICSVRYARKVIPGLRSYGLDSLAQHYKLENEARHRAVGDAKVTAIIFKDLLKRDQERDLFNKTMQRNNKRFQLPLHLDEDDFDKLPKETGVYYMKDKNGTPIYIGKSINIRERLQTHFSSNINKGKTQHLIREVYQVDYKLCGSELIALLLEDLEIRHYWPKYNKAQKTPKQSFGLFDFYNQKGELQFRINRISKGQQPLKKFQTHIEGMEWLIAAAKEWGLHPEFCGFLSENKVEKDVHQKNGSILIAALKELQGDFVYLTEGRTTDEQGFVWKINGRFSALGWIPKELKVRPSVLKEHAFYIGESAFCDKLIDSYVENNDLEKIELEKVDLIVPKGNTLSLF